jgi:cobalt-zinc-cadmium efflux system membrane fusion protein
MKPISRLLYIFFLTASLTFLSCNEGEKSSDNAPETPETDQIFVSREQFQSNAMALGEPKYMSFPEILPVSGMVDVPPENRATVSAISGGFVKNFGLLIGDRVRKGQRIVTLENPEFLQLQQQYLENQGEIPFLKSEYERQKTLLEEKISSEKLFLQAESKYRTSMARSLSLEQQLRLLNIDPKAVSDGKLSAQSSIYAPLDGYITRVNVQMGSYVSQASEIVEIINSNHLHLELTVFEKDVQRLQIGQRIVFSLPEVSEATYEANIHLIGTSLDENRTVKVHAHLKNESETGFLVGMFVRANIEIELENQGETLALPETAVIDAAGTSHILVLESENEAGYTFRQVSVAAGQALDSYVPISGETELNVKSKVLIRGAFNLISPP